jgi:hypothetical protein
MMNDLERFVKRLVERLEARDPTGLYRPVNIGDLRASIMPYRLNRSALELSSHEDYELLVLRLVAEEGGFARTNPPESAARCREEVQSPNPDLDIVEDLGNTTIQFGAAQLAMLGARHSALGTRQASPEPPPPEPPPPEPPPIASVPEPPAPSAERRAPSAECRACHHTLPTHRAVTFCPYCGARVGRLRCVRCGEDVEPDWSHCVSCGTAAGTP